MSDAGENVMPIETPRRLAEAVRDVKNAAADREDVVVELREASRTRLDLLAAELAPVFEDVPAEIDIFDFAISSGLQPRLWIDAVSHVSLGRDRRTYRFLKDTRLGRVVLVESSSIKPVADQVTRYIAERIVERERLLEGGIAHAFGHGETAEPPRQSRGGGWKAFFSGLLLVLAGALAGLAVTMLLLRDRLDSLNLGF
ncbi:hypothetical protein [Pseudaminobacter sp. NGMCC 1.201702]|uniref:hypothetical protein n=1 Tax=Pseudaminobacter sp. NGMCC 1.201702 TaxID=3391825 RepID=UPI0039EE0340